MAAIAIGMPLLVAFMMVVMGTPLIYHLKRDSKYRATRGQPEAARLKIWYGA